MATTIFTMNTADMQLLIDSGMPFQILTTFPLTVGFTHACGCCHTWGLPAGTKVQVAGKHSRTSLRKRFGMVRGVKTFTATKDN